MEFREAIDNMVENAQEFIRDDGPAQSADRIIDIVALHRVAELYEQSGLGEPELDR